MKYLLPFLLLLSSCSSPPQNQKAPVSISALRVQAETIPADFEYIGVGQSSHIVEIRARVEGYLESIDYKEGSMVKEGDLLFVLDKRPFIAEVDSAKGTLEKQQAILWNTEQTKKRMIPLYQQKAVSQKDLDDALSREMAASANVATAEANLYQAELNLSFASITAPVAGLVGEAKYREGALISPTGSQNLLTTLYVVDPIWVNFSVSENDILLFRKQVENKQLLWPKGMNFQVEAILSDGTKLPSEGVIDFANPALQQNTGTMLVRASFPNPTPLIYPGQFVRVIVKGALYPDAIVVPQAAVQQGNDGLFVYVIEGGRAVKRNVTAGSWYKNGWIIESGLKSGETVITQGVNKVQNDTPVVIQNVHPNPLNGS